MEFSNYKSACCGTEVKAEGVPDFLGSNEICTFSFSCTQCGQPCNVVPNKNKQKSRKAATEKRKAQKKQLKSQDEALKKLAVFRLRYKAIRKLVEFFDGITIDLTKGVILTQKKKYQLAELKNLLEPKAEKPK